MSAPYCDGCAQYLPEDHICAKTLAFDDYEQDQARTAHDAYRKYMQSAGIPVPPFDEVGINTKRALAYAMNVVKRRYGAIY